MKQIWTRKNDNGGESKVKWYINYCVVCFIINNGNQKNINQDCLYRDKTETNFSKYNTILDFNIRI